jgi:hypothetical protein
MEDHPNSMDGVSLTDQCSKDEANSKDGFLHWKMVLRTYFQVYVDIQKIA